MFAQKENLNLFHIMVVGGGKAASEIHDKIKEILEKKLGYSAEEAGAIKSLLYDMAKKAAEESGKEVSGLDKAKLMLKHATKKFIEENFSDAVIKKRIKKIEDHRAEKKAQTAGRRRRRSRKTSKKRAPSKKKSVKRAPSKKKSVKRAPSKKKRTSSKK